MVDLNGPPSKDPILLTYFAEKWLRLKFHGECWIFPWVPGEIKGAACVAQERNNLEQLTC